MGHTGKSPGDEDGDDYYDYYNELVGKGADYNNENDAKDEVRKGGVLWVNNAVANTLSSILPQRRSQLPQR